MWLGKESSLEVQVVKREYKPQQWQIKEIYLAPNNIKDNIYHVREKATVILFESNGFPLQITKEQQ